MLCLGVGALASENQNLCGTTLSIDEFTKRYNDYRNRLLNLDLNKVLGNLTGSELLGAITSLYFLLQDSCGLADEFYHLVNKYSCYHHVACDEASSSENNFNCQNNPGAIALVSKLLAYLDNPRLFPGLDTERNTLKNLLIEGYCSSLAGVKLGTQIENCLCCSTRDGNPAITDRECADCAAQFCPQGGGAGSTMYGSSNNGLPSFCAGFDPTANNKKMCERFLTEEGPHTCHRFMIAPVQKLTTSFSGILSNPATSPTGGVRCSATPSPVPTCVSGDGGGVENICLTAPPL
jgi:hypothetical protein